MNDLDKPTPTATGGTEPTKYDQMREKYGGYVGDQAELTSLRTQLAEAQDLAEFNMETARRAITQRDDALAKLAQVEKERDAAISARMTTAPSVEAPRAV